MLVTGAGGFVGRRLTSYLMDSGVNVLNPSHSQLDLTDAKMTATFLRDVSPNTVFHLASGGVTPGRSPDVTLVANELLMTANIIAALGKDTRLIVAGTMAEYGRSGRLSEESPAVPGTLYGIGKLAATLYALAEGRRRNIQVTVGRLFGCYGPGEASHRLFPSILSALRVKCPVDLSDCEQWRDFVHIDDVVEVLAALAEHPEPPAIVNVGTGKAIMVRTICERLADELGAERTLLRFGAIPRRATDEDILEADTDLLARTLGFVPQQRLQVSAVIPLLL